MMGRFFSLLGGVVIMAGLAFPAWAGMPVVLKTSVEVKAPSIRLSDVFEGIESSIDREIAIAPEPGRSVTYDVRVLMRLAEQYRLEWQPQSYADQSTLTRAATFITEDMVREAVRQKLQESGVNAQTEAEVTLDNRNLSIALPHDQAPDFVLNNFSYDARAKRFRTELVAQAGKNAPRQTLSGRVTIKRQVPVLAKKLPAGTLVGQNDLVWITMADDQIGSDVLTQSESIVGQELRRDQAEGAVLRSQDMLSPRLVLRDKLVTLKIATPLMLITTQGRALEDGAKGDVVRIKNAQTNRVVEGIVESSDTVTVQVSGLPQVAAAQ